MKKLLVVALLLVTCAGALNAQEVDTVTVTIPMSSLEVEVDVEVPVLRDTVFVEDTVFVGDTTVVTDTVPDPATEAERDSLAGELEEAEGLIASLEMDLGDALLTIDSLTISNDALAEELTLALAEIDSLQAVIDSLEADTTVVEPEPEPEPEPGDTATVAPPRPETREMELLDDGRVRFSWSHVETATEYRVSGALGEGGITADTSFIFPADWRGWACVVSRNNAGESDEGTCTNTTVEGIALDLMGDWPEHLTLGIMYEPPDSGSVGVQVQVYDADYHREGRLLVNNHGPVWLWETTDDCRPWLCNRDAETVNVQVETPLDWWVEGDNRLTFTHDSTGGYIIEDINLAAVAPEPEPDPTEPGDEPACVADGRCPYMRWCEAAGGTYASDAACTFLESLSGT